MRCFFIQKKPKSYWFPKIFQSNVPKGRKSEKTSSLLNTNLFRGNFIFRYKTELSFTEVKLSFHF